MDRESETPELIERQMADTRESLTEKVSMLEQQVVGKLQSATDAVQETVESVKSAVEDTVQCVTGTVKNSLEGVSEALDVRKRVEETPWLMVGGAAAAGLVTGLILFRGRGTPAGERPAYTAMPAAAFTPPREVPRSPSWLDGLFDAAGKELKKLAEQALATASMSLRETVSTRLPELVQRVVPGGEEEECATGVHHGNGRHQYGDVAPGL